MSLLEMLRAKHGDEMADAAEKLADDVTNATKKSLRKCMEAANHVNGSSLRVKPESPRDWLAVHNYVSVLTQMFIAAGVEVLAIQNQVCKAFATGQGDKQSPFQTLTLCMVLTEYKSLRLLLHAHTRLIQTGVLETDNADIHYERMIGMAEEQFEEEEHGDKARTTDRRAESSGSANQEAARQAEQAEATKR